MEETEMFQPDAPPSYSTPYFIAIWIITPICSILISVFIDILHRRKRRLRIIWRPFWHFLPLILLTYLITWFLNNGYPLGTPLFNPLIVLFFSFSMIHALWFIAYFAGLRWMNHHPSLKRGEY